MITMAVVFSHSTRQTMVMSRRMISTAFWAPVTTRLALSFGNRASSSDLATATYSPPCTRCSRRSMALRLARNPRSSRLVCSRRAATVSSSSTSAIATYRVVSSTASGTTRRWRVRGSGMRSMAAGSGSYSVRSTTGSWNCSARTATRSASEITPWLTRMSPRRLPVRSCSVRA